jgi:hypothetical protein
MKCVDCGKEFFCKGDIVCEESVSKGLSVCLCKKCTCKSKGQIKECGYRELGEKVEFT